MNVRRLKAKVERSLHQIFKRTRERRISRTSRVGPAGPSAKEGTHPDTRDGDASKSSELIKNSREQPAQHGKNSTACAGRQHFEAVWNHSTLARGLCSLSHAFPKLSRACHLAVSGPRPFHQPVVISHRARARKANITHVVL